MHVDRDKSKEAIAKLIKEEGGTVDGKNDHPTNEDIEKLKKRIKERKDGGQDSSDLEKELAREIANEQAMIDGKREIYEIVDGFGQEDAINAKIKEEEDALKKLKEDVANKRQQSSVPRTPAQQKEIDDLDRSIELAKKKIDGKGKAKGALVF
jgi:Rad3-related DNA helicase